IILYVVVAIIIVIMVIVTWGAGSAVVGAIGTLISGVGTVGIVATMVAIEILIAFLVNILIAVVLSVALQYLSEYLGVWGIVVFAALAIALGNYQAIGNAVQGIATSYIAVAQEVLGFVTLMAQYLNNIVLLEDQDLLEEMKEFRDDVKTMQEKMDATSDLLTEVDDSLSDPLRMRRKQDGILYESAGGFYARTLMTNPGAVAIQHGTALVDSLYEYEY
ncbi:MAG: hypothetical protein KAG86_11045, partial [Gammaproteobacteria bacterium]|nr:hypothetical protein [Gammaproteobacteria bacterium]